MQDTFKTTTHMADETVPQYGSKPKKPGLYLGLFHGRLQPCEKMDDWGFMGPAIGPLRWCHTTYASCIKIEFEDTADAMPYFGKAEHALLLEIDGDLLVFGGKYYGDWTVYYVKLENCERPADGFRAAARGSRLFAHREFLL